MALPRNTSGLPIKLFVVMLLLTGMLGCQTLALAQQEGTAKASGRLADIDSNWGGHLRAIGTGSWLDEDAISADTGTNPFYDGQVEWRLNNQLDFGSRWSMQTHYEWVAVGGDLFESRRMREGTAPLSPFLSPSIDDDWRLFDLTQVLTEKDRYLVYHRLDRLNLTYMPDWGTLRLGRQALTWGNGLIFNPMDLFNPFAPTAVQRDYKIGEDMAYAQLPLGMAETQLLYLPRRDPETGDLEEEASSYAVKVHAPAGPVEMDVMAARHYGDSIGSLGASGYVGDAAWRIDTVYTHVAEESDRNDFFQIVANMDYAWMWRGRNVYGLLEFYYNGLGLTENYETLLTDKPLRERLARGEWFTIGRYYLAGQVQIELHPLVHLYTTAIVNLSDPSGVLQPQVMWDVVSDWQIIIGGQWNGGDTGTEFGGYPVTAAGSTIHVAPADRVFLWLTYYY